MSYGEIAALITILGKVPYVWLIVCGRIQPKRSSWLIWTLIVAIALWSSHAAGATDSLWLFGSELVTCGLVFALALKWGKGGMSRLDHGCIAIGVAGTVCWQLTDLPVLALIAVLIADICGVIPTIMGALKDPQSDSATAFAASTAAALCGILAVGRWDLVLLAYPVYLCLINLTTALVIWVGQYHYHHPPVQATVVK